MSEICGPFHFPPPDVWESDYGHTRHRCSKRMAITGRPGFKTIPQQHAAHTQQRLTQFTQSLSRVHQKKGCAGRVPRGWLLQQTNLCDLQFNWLTFWSPLKEKTKMAYFSTLQWHLLLFYTDMSLPITLDILIMDKNNYWLSILNTLSVTKIHNNYYFYP